MKYYMDTGPDHEQFGIESDKITHWKATGDPVDCLIITFVSGSTFTFYGQPAERVTAALALEWGKTE